MICLGTELLVLFVDTVCLISCSVWFCLFCLCWVVCLLICYLVGLILYFALVICGFATVWVGWFLFSLVTLGWLWVAVCLGLLFDCFGDLVASVVCIIGLGILFVFDLDLRWFVFTFGFFLFVVVELAVFLVYICFVLLTEWLAWVCCCLLLWWVFMILCFCCVLLVTLLV